MKIPDKINILGIAKNAAALRLAEAEVRRIGREPSCFVNVISPWDVFCINRLRNGVLTGYMSRPTSFSCNRGHLHIVQAALEMGEDSVWVIEDDTRFFASVDRLNRALASAPADADILILDPIFKDFPSERDCYIKSRSAKGWWMVEKEDIRNGGDYILSRRAAEIYVKLLSQGPDGNALPACDTVRNHNYFHNGINIYVAAPNLSIQRRDEGFAHNTSFDRIYRIYAAQGVALDDYAEW